MTLIFSQDSAFGQFILDYAQSVSPYLAYLNAGTLLNATETMFSSMFANMAHQYLLQQPAASTVTGKLHNSQTRLIVVFPIEIKFLGMLFASMLMLIWVF